MNHTSTNHELPPITFLQASPSSPATERPPNSSRIPTLRVPPRPAFSPAQFPTRSHSAAGASLGSFSSAHVHANSHVPSTSSTAGTSMAAWSRPRTSKPSRSAPSDQREKGKSLIPILKLQNVVYERQQVNMSSKDAAFVLCVATEEFLKRLVIASQYQAFRAKHHLVALRDVAHIVDSTKKYSFLEEVIPKTMTVQNAIEFRQTLQSAETGPTHAENSSHAPITPAPSTVLTNGHTDTHTPASSRTNVDDHDHANANADADANVSLPNGREEPNVTEPNESESEPCRSQ